MRYILVILFLLLFSVCRASYDSTSVMTVTQKYCIDENVSTNDELGYFIPNYSWLGTGTYTRTIETNWNAAFGITAGKLYVADATKINGKIVLQDTIINI